MRANPEPQQAAFDFHRQRAIPGPDPNGPEAAHFLEMQRRMLRILLEERVVLVGNQAHIIRTPLVRLPEPRAREVPHNSRARPSLNSAMAASASPSSLPARASRSILRS